MPLRCPLHQSFYSCSSWLRTRQLLYQFDTWHHDCSLLRRHVHLHYSFNLRSSIGWLTRAFVGRSPLPVPGLHWNICHSRSFSSSHRASYLLLQRPRESPPSLTHPGGRLSRLLSALQGSSKLPLKLGGLLWSNVPNYFWELLHVSGSDPPLQALELVRLQWARYWSILFLFHRSGCCC